MVKLLPDEFNVLSKYIYSISGICLDESKTYLVETRLQRLLSRYDIATFSELYYEALSDMTKSLQNKIIDAITTGETMFFRDAAMFELLQHKILPDLIDLKNRKGRGCMPVPIRIWSAASSTGQEVYSIAMVLKELIPDLSLYNIKIIGTDISDEAVARASYGQYNQFEIDRGLTKDKQTRYFARDSNSWKITDEVRSMATFKKLNLFDDFAGMGTFDIVLCRNVAIYFTEQDKVRLFRRIGGVLESDGYLIIGSTESLTGICPQFKPMRYLRSVFYQLK